MKILIYGVMVNSERMHLAVARARPLKESCCLAGRNKLKSRIKELTGSDSGMVPPDREIEDRQPHLGGTRVVVESKWQFDGTTVPMNHDKPFFCPFNPFTCEVIISGSYRRSLQCFEPLAYAGHLWEA